MKAKQKLLVAVTLMALFLTVWVGLVVAANVGGDFFLRSATVSD
jgi:nitrogen fixation/metabolism regulation signal transduction histidine kinase